MWAAFIDSISSHACGRIHGAFRSSIGFQIDHGAHDGGFDRDFAVYARDAGNFAKRATKSNHIDFDAQLIAGDDRAAEARVIHGSHVHKLVVAILHFAEQEQSADLGYRFDNQDTGHYGFAWKMTLKEVFVNGDVLDSDDTLLWFHFFDGVDEKKGIAVRKNFLDPNAVEDHCAPLVPGSVLISKYSAQVAADDFTDTQSYDSIRNSGGLESALLGAVCG
jgi:hypothetical protein